MTDLVQAMHHWLLGHDTAAPTPAAPLAVAFSGGLDSTALLHVAHSTWPGAVVALHINHGLQVAAVTFEEHCRTVCHEWSVPLRVCQVQVAVSTGDSLEEQARNARYRALAGAARQVGAATVWLAQHADDQAETLLLALSRGAGVAGLGGMGAPGTHHGVAFGPARLLPRQARLKECVHEARLPWVDDPSNAETQFARNRIRHLVMPALLEAFPAMVETLGRSARHCASARQLVDQLAQQDLSHVGLPPGIDQLRTLPDDRLINVLRHWLVRVAGRAPTTAQVDELRKQLRAASTRGHRIQLKVSSGHVCREGAVLTFQPGTSRNTDKPASL